MTFERGAQNKPRLGSNARLEMLGICHIMTARFCEIAPSVPLLSMRSKTALDAELDVIRRQSLCMDIDTC